MKTEQYVPDTLQHPGAVPPGNVGQDCEEFEARLRAGRAVPIETYLPRVDIEVRSTLFEELLRIEVGYRRGRGEAIDRDEYCRRFPEYVASVEQIFNAAVPDTIVDTSANTVIATMQYSRLRYHDAGGIGEIYKAEDSALKRDVALKFIQPRHGSDPTCLGLFLTEAEITSRLDHPGVVPVHGMGESWDGRPFYAMRFVEGTRFREEIEQYHRLGCPRLELHRLLTHLVSVCNTAAYAHNRGIVHRDIKPDNIMIGRFRETLLLDWGLAIPVKRDRRAVESGEKTMVVSGQDSGGKSSVTGAGTIGFMSPEQLPGSECAIGATSDVYSLGGTLYKLLTGEQAFHARQNPDVFEQIRRGAFTPPRQVKRDVPRALEAICLKAMATDPADRYSSAMELAADLQAWMADEPVSVYREPRVEQWSRWIRRHRNVLVYATMAAAAMIVASLLVAVYQGRAAKVEHEARQVADQARETSKRMTAKFAAATVATEIDLRWRILAEHAADHELQQYLLDLASPEPNPMTQRHLQDWIVRRRDAETTASNAWFVDDAQGNLLAISPFKADIVNSNYAGRDYFHGLGRELTDEEAVKAEPIRDAHRSTVYKSTSDGTLRVAFTVPVWPNNERTGDPIGVLGMAVAIGNFVSLETELSGDQTAVLVDLRDDWIEEEPRQGLVLHHPQLAAAQQRNLRQGITAPFRVAPQRVEQLLKLSELSQHQAATGAVILPGSRAIDYRDPVTDESTTAIFEPVLVNSRRSQNRNTGWVVVIQENNSTQPAAMAD